MKLLIDKYILITYRFLLYS